MKWKIKAFIINISAALSALVFSSTSFGASSIDITIDKSSGTSNPVITLSDSLSVALLERRIGHYLILSSSGDPKAPQPLTGPGYRGIKISNYALGNDSLEICGSNGAFVINVSSPRTYIDVHSEFEKMALRFCKRLVMISSFSPVASSMHQVPDSLCGEHTKEGFLSIEESYTLNSINVDFSMLNDDFSFLPLQDTVFDSDFSFGFGSGVRYILNARFGIIDKGTLQGFPEIMAISQSNAAKLIDSCQNVLKKVDMQPPHDGYLTAMSLIDQLQPGRFFIIRTSEGGYVALVYAGESMTDISRYIFYYSFSTDGIFKENMITSNRLPSKSKENFYTGNKNMNGKNGSLINMQGRRITGCGQHISPNLILTPQNSAKKAVLIKNGNK